MKLIDLLNESKTVRLNERLKPITKKHWDKADDDQKYEWLSQAFKDPMDAEQYVEYEWIDLPPDATQNMYESVNARLNEGWMDLLTYGPLAVTAALSALSLATDTAIKDMPSKAKDAVSNFNLKSILKSIKAKWRKYTNSTVYEIIQKMVNDPDIVNASKNLIKGPRGGRRPDLNNAAYLKALEAKLSPQEIAILKNFLKKIKGSEVGNTKSFQSIQKYTKGESVNEGSYKVAGRPVTLIKGKKSDGTDWKVKFQNGKEVPLSDVLALIKPFPKGIKESVNEARGLINLKAAMDALNKSKYVDESQLGIFTTTIDSKVHNGNDAWGIFLRDYARNKGVSDKELGKMSLSDMNLKYGDKAKKEFNLKGSKFIDFVRQLVKQGQIELVKEDVIDEGNLAEKVNEAMGPVDFKDGLVDYIGDNPKLDKAYNSMKNPKDFMKLLITTMRNDKKAKKLYSYFSKNRTKGALDIIQKLASGDI
jgi:hypothetical protein